MKHPPKGIYLVAIAFFLAGLICLAEPLGAMTAMFGLEPGRSLTTLEFVLPAFVLGLCLVCAGVFSSRSPDPESRPT